MILFTRGHLHVGGSIVPSGNCFKTGLDLSVGVQLSEIVFFYDLVLLNIGWCHMQQEASL